MMGDKSEIEWTDATWNPTRGCSRVSSGCKGCYAERVAMRFSGPGQPYEGLVRMVNGAPTWTGEMRLAENMLTLPLSWKKGRMVFVDSMSDLFHVGVPFGYIDKVFAMMAMCPQHRFQVLTKRPERMLEYVTSRNAQRIHEAAKAQLGYDNPKRRAVNDWPLANVWLGVSAEDQATAGERIPFLLCTPAAVRFVSAEPLLGAMNLRSLDYKSGAMLPEPMRVNDGRGIVNALEGRITWPGSHYVSPTIKTEIRLHGGTMFESRGEARAIDWVIAGGESGPKARPSHPDWHRSLRDQCAATGVPFLFKQWGEWSPMLEGHAEKRVYTIGLNGEAFEGLHRERVDDAHLTHTGKKASGRLLDGVEHNGFPEAC